MQDRPNKPEQSAADIAREAFRRLAAQRIAPTPDAYQKIYDEIAGNPPQYGAERILADFAAEVAAISESAAQLSADLARAASTRDWNACALFLTELVENHLHQVIEQVASSMPAPSGVTTAPTVRKHDQQVANMVPASSPAEVPPAAAHAPTTDVDTRQEAALRDLLARTLSLGIASLLRTAPELAEEAENLAATIRNPQPEKALDEFAARIKQLCFKIELHSEDMAEEKELLLRLFRLLLENVSELLEDDSWLSGQMDSVQTLLAGPISHGVLEDATRNLKEVIYKQSMLKHSLAEAKVTVKNMMITFIDRLGAVAASTDDYHKKIDRYSQKISQARDITALNAILDDVMRDTKVAQTEALRSRDDMVVARREVQEAEAKVAELEARLEQMSELVREDELTGSLNRRGLDDAFERELARAERRATPLCIALLDLDDFKRLNDTYGHSAGDEALIHLVRVVKDTLRTMDVIARFGGEEFLIVLPDTPLDAATQTITRVQRELTKRIFMHDNAKLLITFSAGVALRAPGEDQHSLIKRADEALYKAKKAGKNRVVAAN